jgi:hypothetical protein
MPYQLNIAINQAALQTLTDNNQQIILIKATPTGAAVWVSLSPLSNNCIQWDENYYLYAQMGRASTGSQIQMDYQTAALPGHSYDFRSFGSFFLSGVEAAQPNGYQIINLFTQQAYTTFGMAQPVRINGSLAMVNPINSYSASGNTTITFNAMNRVTIFTSNTLTMSEMMPNTFSANALTVNFNSSINELNVIYNAETGGFVMAGL